jgi:hypothetical protein
MKSNHLITVCCLSALIYSSCSQNGGAKNNNTAMHVKDSVAILMDQTAQKLYTDGPIAWLHFFENSPEFYMASNGSIAFKDYPTAERFIRDTLVKNLKRINLKWSDAKIDSLTPEFADVRANFHEDLTITLDKVIPVDGYFTALAHKTDSGWRYRNLHWSIKGK